MANQLFIELLQVAIGQRCCLSKVLTGEEWRLMYELFKKHALPGIGYVAIQRLPKEQWPPSNIVLSLTAYATQIKAKNTKLTEECRKVVRQMEHDSIHAVVIKGQSNWENYPEELREYRNPGDIDVWTKLINDTGIPVAEQTGDSVEYVYYKGIRGIIEYARLQRRLREDKSLFKPLYYHVEYHTDKGTEVEMHYRPSFLCSPIRNMRMQRWFKEQFDVCLKNKCRLGFPVLTSSVNVVYQLVHLYRHVFEGGIGLRQLMDYYFALRVWHNDVMECKDLQTQGMWSEGMGMPVMSKEEVMSVLRSFGMGKFAGAVMYVLHEAFENEECRMKKQRSAAEGKANEECCSADRGSERGFTRINRELKENNIYPQINTDGHGCPQADEVGEQQLSAIGQQLKKNNCAPWMICEPNEREGQLLINDERLRINDYPWLLCEPNEVEGKKLLAEIMQGGNFGQYDTRDAALKKGGMMKHGLWKLKRVMRLVRSYPEEALWEPVFRVWHLVWRGING